jgi:thiol:disulfide interchange protein DsbC
MRWHLIQLALLLLGATTRIGATDDPVDRGARLMDQIRAAARQEMLTAIPPNRRIIVSPTQPVKHRVTVFTDTDCPYCRKFHQQIRDYLRAGIEVQYIFYPRSGPDSPAYARAVAVWCSKDREAALAAALNGDPIPSRTCDNPVAEHYELAIRLGLLGTPALITEDGVVMYGAVAVSRLLDRPDALNGAR